ncbi:MAG TPA: hypothetical protein VFE10_15125 [Phenylobacterium sp.]|jgi:hypothetical protein|nr:hypothetical protein [Phenylobacterium sp.]
MIDRRSLLAAAGAAAWTGGARAAPAPAGDLTGVWTNAWYTWLQRPKAFKALVVPPAEAEAYEAPRRAHKGELIDPVHDVLGQNESEFPDNGPGLARIRGEIRSSWIVDPADGRIPWKPEARTRLHIGRDTEDYDNVEARDTDERCLTNASGAAPLVNSHDANLIQIVQTPGWLAIVGEKDHETRIVEIVGPGLDARRSMALGSWTGVSRGHWDGATLVVETTDLRPGATKISDDIYLSEHARVTERFTRTGPNAIAYQFEVEDPTLFTQVWRGEEVFRTAEGPMYEYACHEGNYSLPGILRAARAADGKTAGEK